MKSITGNKSIHKSTSENQQGFTLLEVLIAVTILSLVGLMSWRGMDAMIKGNEVIDQRRVADSAHLNLIKQFDKDCSEIPNPDQLGFTPYAVSQNELLLLRKSKLNGQTTWILVTYKITKEGLQRQIVSSNNEIAELKIIIENANKNFTSDRSNFEINMKIDDIANQKFFFLPEPLTAGRNEIRGIQAQWFVKNVKEPITRSCLIGQGI